MSVKNNLKRINFFVKAVSFTFFIFIYCNLKKYFALYSASLGDPRKIISGSYLVKSGRFLYFFLSGRGQQDVINQLNLFLSYSQRNWLPTKMNSNIR